MKIVLAMTDTAMAIFMVLSATASAELKHPSRTVLAKIAMACVLSAIAALYWEAAVLAW